MTGTLTATVDPTLRRVGVQLGAWAAADGPVTVKRIHANTSEYPVRGIPTTSGGVGFVYDYEPPFNQSVTYYAFDGATQVLSNAVTIVQTVPMLRVPGLPALDINLLPVGRPTVTRDRAVTVLQPLGRPTGIALMGPRQAPKFPLQVITRTNAETTTLLAALTQGATHLLVFPGAQTLAWQYITIGAVSEGPLTRHVPPAGAAPDDSASWSQWSLTCTAVDIPVGGVFGDPTASYAAVKATYPTYTDLRSAKTSYLQILKGVP